MPQLVLHADDFGLNQAVSDGILRGFTHGLLTSTSILANAPDYSRALNSWQELLAAQRGQELPSREVRRTLGDSSLPFDFGVHLNLTQGQPLTGRCYPSSLLDGQRRFPGIGRTFAALSFGASRFRPAIRAELSAQIERVQARGLDVVHLNGHQYVELIPLVGDLAAELANQSGIRSVRLAREPGIWRALRATGDGPAAYLLAAAKRGLSYRLARALTGSSIAVPCAFFGTAHAGRIDLAVCREFLRTTSRRHSQLLSTGESERVLFEIAFHPALYSQDDTSSAKSDGWGDPIAPIRLQECDLLTGDALVALLRSFPLHLGRLRELPLSAMAS